MVHYHTYIVHVEYSQSNATMMNGFLHELGFPLGLGNLCKTMRTKRVLRALCTLLRALCGLGGRHCARLGERYGRHVRCKTRNTNIMVAFCE